MKYRIIELIFNKTTLYRVQESFLGWFWSDVPFALYDTVERAEVEVWNLMQKPNKFTKVKVIKEYK